MPAVIKFDTVLYGRPVICEASRAREPIRVPARRLTDGEMRSLHKPSLHAARRSWGISLGGVRIVDLVEQVLEDGVLALGSNA